jgi:hypothetical protein
MHLFVLTTVLAFSVNLWLFITSRVFILTKDSENRRNLRNGSQYHGKTANYRKGIEEINKDTTKMWEMDETNLRNISRKKGIR